MKKRIIITTIIIAIALLAIGLNITGFATQDPETPIINVTRLITKNQTEDTTVVRIGIVSSENILAVNETFIPEDCKILNAFSTPEIDILEINEQALIIANNSDTLNVDVYYTLSYNCDVDKTAGEVLILTNNDQLTSNTFGEQNEETDGGDTSGGGPSGGGPSGGSPSTTNAGLQSTPITQAETEKEFDQIIENSINNILGIDESKDLDLKSLIMWIVLGAITLLVIIGLLYSLMGKSKQQFKTNPKTSQQQS